MKLHVLKGSKQEIVERLAQISGDIREAIVFEDEPAPDRPPAALHDSEEFFAAMASFMVQVTTIDDSREAIYTRSAGE